MENKFKNRNSKSNQNKPRNYSGNGNTTSTVFHHLRISRIQFTRFMEGPGLVAFFNISFDDSLIVYGMRLVRTNENQYLVLWPEHEKTVKGKGFVKYIYKMLESGKTEEVKKVLLETMDSNVLTSAAPCTPEFASYVTSVVIHEYKSELRRRAKAST